MPKNISIVFDADTGKFVTNVAGAGQAIRKLREEEAAAKNSAIQWRDEQLKAAQEVNASAKEMAQIKLRSMQMIAQAEEEANRKIAAAQDAANQRRFSKLQEAAARETNLIRTQVAEQTRAAQSAALRSDVQNRVTADPLAGTKASIAAAYKAEIAAAREVGASEEELAAITKRFAQQRAEAVEKAEEEIIAARNQARAKQYANEISSAEQSALRAQLESQQPPVLNPLQQSKSDIAAAYKAEIAVAREAGASEEQLAAITKRFAQERVAAVEKAEEEIIAARNASRREQFQAEISANEQAAIKQQLQSAEPQGFWARLFGGPSAAQSAARDAESVAGSLNKVEQAAVGVGRGTQPITALDRAIKGNAQDALRTAVAFGSQIKLIQTIATAAFIPLGIMATVGILKDGYDAAKKWYDTARELPSKIAEGFESIDAPLRNHVDGLRKANAELENEILHLEHKPENHLAEALAEDIQKADQLAESASKAASEVEKLLKDNRVSFAQQLFLGKGDTKELSTELSRRFSEIATLQNEDRKKYRYDVDNAKTDEEKQAAEDRHSARQGVIAGKINSDQQFIQQQRAVYNGPVIGYTDVYHKKGEIRMNPQTGKPIVGDQSAVNALLNGSEDLWDDAQLNTIENKQNVQLTGKKKTLQEQEENARKYAEAVRKAVEAQKQAWKQEDDARIEAGRDSETVEINTWAKRRATLSKNAMGYVELLDFLNTEVAQHIKEGNRQQTEEQRKAAAEAEKKQREGWMVDFDQYTNQKPRTPQQNADFWSIRILEATPGSDNEREALNRYTEALKQVTQEAERAARAKERAAAEAEKQATQYQEASVALQEQTGVISRNEAAFQRANIHAEQYRQEMARLQQELSRQKSIDPDSSATIEAQANIDKAVAERRIQIMQDAAATAATTWQGALTNANAVWVQDAEDSAKQVTELYHQAVDGLNNDIADKMVGEKSNFAGTFRSIGKTLAEDSLKKIEAPILSALGLKGKPDGSRSNPLFVTFADQMEKVKAGIGGNQTAKDLGNKLFPELASMMSGDSSDGSDASGDSDTPNPPSTGKQVLGGIFRTVGSLFGSIFGGGRALGGSVQAGVAYDVGEQGRETFIPQTNGTIIPHHALGGGNTYYDVNVANGVTPEQMAIHVQQALREFHPHVVRDSVNAMHRHNANVPSTRRQ